MIRVHLTVLVFLYLTVFLLVVGAAALLDARRRAQRARRALHFRLRCAICGLEFEDRTEAALPVCPCCGRPNERVAVDPL